MTSWAFTELQQVLIAIALVVVAIVALCWVEHKRTRG